MASYLGDSKECTASHLVSNALATYWWHGTMVDPKVHLALPSVSPYRVGCTLTDSPPTYPTLAIPNYLPSKPYLVALTPWMMDVPNTLLSKRERHIEIDKKNSFLCCRYKTVIYSNTLKKHRKLVSTSNREFLSLHKYCKVAINECFVRCSKKLLENCKTNLYYFTSHN